MRVLSAVLVLFAAFMMTPLIARAEDPLETTRHMIEGQIDAFLKDDPDVAYEFASTGMKAL